MVTAEPAGLFVSPARAGMDRSKYREQRRSGQRASPARAGMDLAAVSLSDDQASPARAGMDLGKVKASRRALLYMQLPPHARGWTPDYNGPSCRQWILFSLPPHARGWTEGIGSGFLEVEGQLPPHARGWTEAIDNRDQGRFPRTRGDGPSTEASCLALQA